MNLSCSSAANPPAVNYTWYRRTDPGGSGGLQVGSGQVLYISSMEESLSGLYLCRARNPLGEMNSTEVLLAMVEEEEQGLCLVLFGTIILVKCDELTRVCVSPSGSLTLPVLAGLGVALMVAFAFALFLFW